ncbi:unnamed protein product [Fraxinus pennsylvanica]|uniref:Large ribosomal subunit protein uL15/eL18 domain-containing protein n=1 Tax=Fraxinus pennsylvanica TaxID=56036 RepID=A0AAD1YZY4_9LAMI|nr:unnamed protein product [Fraxinus pennsylvanica]
MTTSLKKRRKKHGHVSADHGRIGKHRKHPEGRGNAGGMRHHCILFDKYHPGYFAKAQVEKSKESAPVIDVTEFGYFKVLGKGVLPPSQLVVVKAKLVSKIAEGKNMEQKL